MLNFEPILFWKWQIVKNIALPKIDIDNREKCQKDDKAPTVHIIDYAKTINWIHLKLVYIFLLGVLCNLEHLG